MQGNSVNANPNHRRNLIPGRGEPIEGGTVITEFGQIAYAGTTTEAPPAVEGEEFHEVTAIMPGLWDCHAHFVGLPMTNLEAMGSADIVAAAARAVDDAAACLDAGVTSVREVGGIGIRLSGTTRAKTQHLRRRTDPVDHRWSRRHPQPPARFRPRSPATTPSRSRATGAGGAEGSADQPANERPSHQDLRAGWGDE